MSSIPSSPPAASERRTSFSSASGRPNVRSQSSDGSSRGTSFSLPDEARKGIRADNAEREADPTGEVEVEEEMDEESVLHSINVRYCTGH